MLAAEACGALTSGQPKPAQPSPAQSGLQILPQLLVLLCRAQLSTAQIVEQVIEALRLVSSQTIETPTQTHHANGSSALPMPSSKGPPSETPGPPQDSHLPVGNGSHPALVSTPALPQHPIPALPPITNIVFMGMGEPLHNLAAVMSAVDILCDPTGLQFSHNKVRRLPDSSGLY